MQYQYTYLALMGFITRGQQAVVANWNLGLDDAGAPPFGGVLRTLDVQGTQELVVSPLNGTVIVVTLVTNPSNQSLCRLTIQVVKS